MIQLPIFRRTLIAIFIVCMMIVSFGCADLHKKSTLLSGKTAKTDDAKLYALEMSNTPDSIEQGQQADSTDAFSDSEENPADLNSQGTPENDSASIEIQNHLDEALGEFALAPDVRRGGFQRDHLAMVGNGHLFGSVLGAPWRSGAGLAALWT